MCSSASGFSTDDMSPGSCPSAVARTARRTIFAERVFVPALPKTRSAKIVRRAVRARVLGQDPGDLSTVENPEALDAIQPALAPL